MIHIAHVIYRLDFGGMENGLVNLVNRLPAGGFRHTILCLTHATDFRDRIAGDNVTILEFNKPEGNDLRTLMRIRRALRDLQPDIVHSRNIGALDISIISRLAGKRAHVHGEHGWNFDDLGGESRRRQLIRRVCDKFVDQYIAVSDDIRQWLVDQVGIDSRKITTIRNGVDLNRFVTAGSDAADGPDDRVRFGTVGRQEPIKGLDTFIEAVHIVLQRRPELRSRMAIVMAGDGPSHTECRELCENYRITDLVELPGMVDDVPGLLRDFDFFVQPSLKEGISNTVLEAMASGLAVIATNVGGNPELVQDGVEGSLVAAADPAGLAEQLVTYIEDPESRRSRGAAARVRAVGEFSLDVMASRYEEFYTAVAA